jgi:DNA-binding XRE family transcriptional regulator
MDYAKLTKKIREKLILTQTEYAQLLGVYWVYIKHRKYSW